MEHTVHLRPEVERLVEAIAEARERDAPDAFGSLGHLPNVLRDALALGLEQLQRRHGLARPTAADQTWARVRATVEAGEFPAAAEQADRFLADLLRDGPTASWAPDRETHFAVATVVYELARRAAVHEPEAERLAEDIAETFAEAGTRPAPDAASVLRDALGIGLERLGVESGLFGPESATDSAPSRVLTERAVVAQLRLPDPAVTSIAVLDPACVELRTDVGDAVALERRTLERALAILDYEQERARGAR